MNSLSTAVEIADSFESAPCITIFCGAGVTQDRTGLSWSELNEQLVAASKNRAKKYLKKQLDREVTPSDLIAWGNVLDDYFSSRSVREEMKASVTRTLVEADYNDNNNRKYFNKILASLLYKDVDWENGRLLDNLVLLIQELAIAGKSVEILTTNYDSYIEDELFRNIQNSSIENCGLAYFCYGDSSTPTTRKELIPGVNMINLRYLHGRIDRWGRGIGHIVLSEVDYARTHGRTEKLINTFINQGPTLICGSSISDPPLVQALIRTHISESNHYRRFALVRGNNSSLDDILKFTPTIARAHQLGIDLVPYTDHARCAELILDTVAFFQKGRFVNRQLCSSKKMQENWISNLILWNEKGSFSRLSEKIYEDLVDCKNDVLPELLRNTDKREVFKIECWFVDNSTARSEEIELVLYSNTIGPTLDLRSARREAVTRVNSGRVASVQAYMTGRPILRSLEQLDLPQSNSRWKTYLCVPFGPIDDGIIFPYIGVITVASNMSPASLSDRLNLFNARDSIKDRGSESSILWRIKSAELKTLVGMLGYYGAEIAGFTLKVSEV